MCTSLAVPEFTLNRQFSNKLLSINIFFSYTATSKRSDGYFKRIDEFLKGNDTNPVFLESI